MDINVSIIVPVYNAERYLQRCINSILSQTYKNFECILIDDGSLDSSLEICKNICMNDNRFKVIAQNNQGVSIARNNGIKKAVGKWITFIDADDWIENNLLEDVVKIAEEKKTDFIQYSCFESKSDYEENIISQPEGCFVIDNIHPMIWHAAWSKLINRRFIVENEIYFPEKISLAEDLYFSFKVITIAKQSYCINKPYYHYFQNENSVMHKLSEKNLDDEKWVVDELERYINTNNLITEYNKILLEKKIRIKNKNLFRLKKPRFDRWRVFYPELTNEIIKSSSTFFQKIFFTCIKYKLDSFANIIYNIRYRK